MPTHSDNAVRPGLSNARDLDAPPLRPFARGTDGIRALKAAAAFWYGVTVFGQMIFVIYIAGFYGGAAIRGDLSAWSKVMPRGFVAGDAVGNTVVGMHLLFAALITVSGALQLLPVIRRVAPTLHRWNGRFYLASAVLMSVGGLVMVWTRGGVGAAIQHVAISINALLILACAGMALREALARRFDAHRRWALRLFLVVSGVWFFRVGLMAWVVLNQGPVGFDPDTFRGPFLSFLAFAQFLLPLAILQLYFVVQQRAGPWLRHAMAATLVALTLLTALGIGAASMLMWLPKL